MSAKILTGQSADMAEPADPGQESPRHVITNIKQQVKRPDRYSVFVDGKYTLSLSDSGLLEYKLYVGMQLDKDDIPKLQNDAAFDKLYGLALAYAMRRRRSIWELKQYFRQKKADEDLAAKVMDRMKDYGHIDDLAFARSWIDNRRTLKAVSRRRLQLELRQKGVSDEVVSEAMGEDETTDGDALQQLVLKKRSQTRYQDDQKLMQYLARQGFGYDDIKRAMQAD